MSTKWTRAAAIVLALAAIGLGACRQDMHDQPKYEPLEKSTFFPDGSSARQPPANTVARGELREDSIYYTGYTEDDQLVDKIPIEVTRRTLERGQTTFNAFCSPCHDQVGTGRGMIVRRGFPQPPTYHQERLRNVKDGYIFDVITNGFARMPSYASQIPVADRWAVVAYVRALQLSQHVPLDELPPAERQEAEATGLLPADITEVKDVRGNPNPPAALSPAGAAGTEATTNGTH